LHSYPIPVGATGHIAQQIWQQVSQEPQRFYGSINIAKELEILGEPTWLTDKTQSLSFLGCFLLLKGKTILLQLILFL